MAGLDVNTATISIEHVTIPSQKPFESVKAALAVESAPVNAR